MTDIDEEELDETSGNEEEETIDAPVHEEVDSIENIEETPDESLLYYWLGASLCALNKIEEGKTFFNTALEKSDKPEKLKKDIEEKFVALD